MPKGIPNSHRLKQKGGSNVEFTGQSAESWLKTERVPELPTKAPTNLAVIYVGNNVPEAEAEVLPKAMGRDVVLVVLGSELASHMETRFAASGGSLWVVDYLDPLAREGYLSWLGKLARRYPRSKVVWGVLALDSVRGRHPRAVLGEMELVNVMEIAPHVFKKELVENQIPPQGRPAELWVGIPVDDVPRWVKGESDGSTFDVPAEDGTLRVELRGVDPERRMAQFYIYRRDTGENVASLHVIVDGQECHGIDADVLDALKPCPEGTEVMLRAATSGDDEDALLMKPRSGDSAAPRDVDEEGEPNETDNG